MSFKFEDLLIKLKVEDNRENKGKLTPNQNGLFRVIKEVKANTYHLQDMKGKNLPHIWHSDHIKIYHCRLEYSTSKNKVYCISIIHSPYLLLVKSQIYITLQWGFQASRYRYEDHMPPTPQCDLRSTHFSGGAFEPYAIARGQMQLISLMLSLQTYDKSEC